MDYIRRENCRDGYLYAINARNSHLGVSTANGTGFIISRFKGSNYLFVEYHWDNEEFATVKPIKELEKVPEKLTDPELLDYLNRKADEYKEELNGMREQLIWKHSS